MRDESIVESAAGDGVVGEGVASIAAEPVAGDAERAVDLDRALEAILFISDEPVPLVALAAAVSQPVARVREALARLCADYDGKNGTTPRGFELREVGGGYRMYVRSGYEDIVGDFVAVRQPARLSQAALETLTVIAYRQPVTRSQVAQVRAVNVDSVVRTLLARGLITESGNDPQTGAILYETTELLLEHLGINSTDELPKISPFLDDGRDGFSD